MATRIGLVADTHIPEARATLWPQVYEAFDGVERILHGGDVHDLSLLNELEKVAPGTARAATARTAPAGGRSSPKTRA